ncbi:MAG TPA: NADP-dependent oxidoreductase, partial [Phenylobacterium sp.]
QKLPDLNPESHLLSVFGVAGLTAYFGLREGGWPKAGETVVVSAAAGSVGSIVGQIAKIQGSRVVGITGGEAKGRWLVDELGFDAAVDYKSPEFKRQLRAACPEGIDLYFDNTGGDVFEACLFAMKMHGRIICCGAVSQYDGAAPPHGPRGVPGLIVTKRLTLRGFIFLDFAAQNDRALADLRGWVKDGQLKVKEEIIDGLENLPGALIGLLHGENRGKRMVRV